LAPPSCTDSFFVNRTASHYLYSLSLHDALPISAKRDDFQRYNGSVQVGTQVNDWLAFNVGALYSKRSKHYPYVTNSTTADPWLYSYRSAPTYPKPTEDGDPLRSPHHEMEAANTA